MPAGVEVAQMPLHRILTHGAERRGDDAVRGLGTPPHHAVARIGTAKAVAEKSALPERRLHAPPERRLTGVVDRLEKAGLVRRERDANDRRKVFIATVPENIARIGHFYEPMQPAMLKVWDTYSDAELRLLLRFATQGYKTMLVATEELKAMMKNPKGERPGPAKPSRAP